MVTLELTQQECAMLQNALSYLPQNERRYLDEGVCSNEEYEKECREIEELRAKLQEARLK